jgi:hypothetical protein
MEPPPDQPPDQETGMSKGSDAKIFISYRRDDNAAGYTRSLAEELRRVFGADQVFRDIKSIEAGGDFRRFIEDSLDSSVVVLVAIGKRWLLEAWEAENGGSASQQERDRLRSSKDGEADDEGERDWVRTEVATALRRSVRVIPLLLGEGAELPPKTKLPSDMRDLLSHQHFRISDRNWADGVAELIEELKKIPGLDPLRVPVYRRIPGWAYAAAAGVAAILAVGWMLRSQPYEGLPGIGAGPLAGLHAMNPTGTWKSRSGNSILIQAKPRSKYVLRDASTALSHPQTELWIVPGDSDWSTARGDFVGNRIVFHMTHAEHDGEGEPRCIRFEGEVSEDGDTILGAWTDPEAGTSDTFLWRREDDELSAGEVQRIEAEQSRIEAAGPAQRCPIS